MVHLITGYRGYEHIKSADQGRFNSSFFGASEYVMESGNQCKAQYINNNTVRILDGDILMQGRHISIEPDSYEDLTIATGTAGTNRADLIVMTYKENEADGIEDAYLEVIQGTETTGTATLPTYTSGNILAGATYNQMPLYRVDVAGVTLQQTITPLFKSIPTYATLAEKYEQKFIEACESHLDSLNILDSMSEIENNTESYQMAGALALKEYSNHNHNDLYYAKNDMDYSLGLKLDTRRIAVVSAELSTDATTGYATKTLSYPSGFTRTNCMVIGASFGGVTGVVDCNGTQANPKVQLINGGVSVTVKALMKSGTTTPPYAVTSGTCQVCLYRFS